MASEAYYVRSRGKVTGPFDLIALQKLVRRGSLSRMHEVSSDRVSWASAGDFGELFTARVPMSAAAASAADNSPSPTDKSSSGAAGVKYFYVQNGITVGPVSLPVLISLTQNGTLRPEDFCWQEGSDMALPASHLPALAAVFPVGGAEMRQQSISRSQVDRTRAGQIISDTFSGCQIAGVVAGCVLLLFLNLPLGATRDRTIWWWDSLNSSNTQSVIVLCFFILIAGLATTCVGMFVRGFVRAWIFIGLSALSLILILVALQNFWPDGAELFFSLISFYLAAALIGTSYFRRKAPDAKIGTIFQPIFGGGLLLSVIVLTILGLAQNRGSQMELFNAVNLPGWAVLVITAAVIGSVSAIVSGILGLIGMRQRMSGNLYWSTLAFAVGSVVLPFIAAMIWVCEFVNSADLDEKGMWIFLAFRICAIFLAFLALMSIGLTEVLITARFSPPALDHPQR